MVLVVGLAEDFPEKPYRLVMLRPFRPIILPSQSCRGFFEEVSQRIEYPDNRSP